MIGTPDPSILFPNPKPPSDGGLLGKIVKIIKGFFNIFRKPAQEAGNTDSVNDNSSLENIERITQIFTDFKNQVSSRTAEIENAVNDEVNYYVEELLDILNNNPNMVEKYGIHIKRINRQISKITSRIHGTMDSIISKKVSLDNAECKAIIQMIPGSKKEEAMRSFLNSTFNEALNFCCGEIRSCLDEIYEDVEIEVIGAVDSLQKQTESLNERLKAIDEDNYEASSKKQISDSMYIVGVCDYLEEIL